MSMPYMMSCMGAVCACGMECHGLIYNIAAFKYPKSHAERHQIMPRNNNIEKKINNLDCKITTFVIHNIFVFKLIRYVNSI